SNGRTLGSGPSSLGSNPSPAASRFPCKDPVRARFKGAPVRASSGETNEEGQMGRLLTFLLVLAAFAVPAALAKQPAPSTTSNQPTAAHPCKAQLKSMGAKDFNSVWRNCGHCAALSAEQNQANVTSAEDKCRTEQANDPAGFANRCAPDQNGNKKTAFG